MSHFFFTHISFYRIVYLNDPREEAGQFTIFAHSVNRILCKNWHRKQGICFTFLHWQEKHKWSGSDGAHISASVRLARGETGSAVRGNQPFRDKQEQNPDLLCMFLQVASKVYWQITTCGRWISDREVSGGCTASLLIKDQIITGIIEVEDQTAQIQ